MRLDYIERVLAGTRAAARTFRRRYLRKAIRNFVPPAVGERCDVSPDSGTAPHIAILVAPATATI